MNLPFLALFFCCQHCICIAFSVVTFASLSYGNVAAQRKSPIGVFHILAAIDAGKPAVNTKQSLIWVVTTVLLEIPHHIHSQTCVSHCLLCRQLHPKMKKSRSLSLREAIKHRLFNMDVCSERLV